MALAQSKNEVTLEGILSEIEHREINDAIAGRVILQCKIKPNPKSAEYITSLVPVEFYANPVTKKGTANPAYKKIMHLIENGKPLASGAEPEEATKVRVKAQFRENSFAKTGEIITSTRLSGNFFDEVKNADFKPSAIFEVRMVVSAILPEIKNIENEKQETGDLIVKGYVVQYDGSLEEIKLVVRGKKYVDNIEQYWNVMDTVNASGFLRFVSETSTYSVQEDGFGDPLEKTFTRNTREFIVTNGSRGESDNPYDKEEISEGVKARARKLDAILEKEKNPPTQSKTEDRGW